MKIKMLNSPLISSKRLPVLNTLAYAIALGIGIITIRLSLDNHKNAQAYNEGCFVVEHDSDAHFAF